MKKKLGIAGDCVGGQLTGPTSGSRVRSWRPVPTSVPDGCPLDDLGGISAASRRRDGWRPAGAGAPGRPAGASAADLAGRERCGTVVPRSRLPRVTYNCVRSVAGKAPVAHPVRRGRAGGTARSGRRGCARTAAGPPQPPRAPRLVSVGARRVSPGTSGSSPRSAVVGRRRDPAHPTRPRFRSSMPASANRPPPRSTTTCRLCSTVQPRPAMAPPSPARRRSTRGCR